MMPRFATLQGNSIPGPGPPTYSEAGVGQHLQPQGYPRGHARGGGSPPVLSVVQDRLRAGSADPARLAEAIETAFRHGQGRLSVHALDDEGADRAVWRFSQGLHCAECDITYAEPRPSLFSFHSPLGACEACRGFGRVIGTDTWLVIHD